MKVKQGTKKQVARRQFMYQVLLGSFAVTGASYVQAKSNENVVNKMKNITGYQSHSAHVQAYYRTARF